MLQSPESASSDRPLLEKDVASDPLTQFDVWYTDAVNSGVAMPHAMVLATATKDGHPSGRVVLLKDYGERGFVFFTNYDSRKGKEMEKNPSVALIFHWVSLERQVRIEGSITRVSAEESEQYFHSRPLISQISAAVSQQSAPVKSREELEKKAAEFTQALKGKPVQCPPNWGGYIVRPVRIEFWQGRSGRLHDRILYEFLSPGTWSLHRLQP